jgi:hypothetical protein
MEPLNHDDETLPNFVKKKHPKKGNKKKGPKLRQAKEPQRGEPQGGNGTISTKTSTTHMKHIN